jgi:hypothetical protein
MCDEHLSNITKLGEKNIASHTNGPFFNKSALWSKRARTAPDGAPRQKWRVLEQKPDVVVVWLYV